MTQPSTQDADSTDNRLGAKAPGAQSIRYFWLTVGVLTIITTLITVISTTHGGSDKGSDTPVAAATSRNTSPTSAGHGLMTVQLSTVAPGKGGIATPGSPQYPSDGLPRSLSTSSSFPYALSTFEIGFAGCRCVPPISPDYLTLAFMPATTCRSISLTVLAPWGGRYIGPVPVGPGSDEIYLVQQGVTTATARVDGNTPLATLNATLAGGPWEIRVSELAPAANGNQATVFVNGTLSCTTPTGT